MTAPHYFETGMYRDCSCGWRAPQGSWDTSVDLRKLWERRVSAITQDGGPVIDRLQQKAEELMKEFWPSDLAPRDKYMDCYEKGIKRGLTAGIAMAAEELVELRSLWMERAKRLRKDPSYTDCAVTLESCADELSSLRALTKGET